MWTADFDGNGEVDFYDFLLLSKNFGSDGKTHAHGDTNRDGSIDFADFLTFSRAFHHSNTAAQAVDAAMEEIAAESSRRRTQPP